MFFVARKYKAAVGIFFTGKPSNTYPRGGGVISVVKLFVKLTLSGLNLPLSSSSTTSRESRLVVDEEDLMWFKNYRKSHELVNQFHKNFRSKTLSYRKIKSVFRDVKCCFNAS